MIFKGIIKDSRVDSIYLLFLNCEDVGFLVRYKLQITGTMDFVYKGLNL